MGDGYLSMGDGFLRMLTGIGFEKFHTYVVGVWMRAGIALEEFQTRVVCAGSTNPLSNLAF